MDWNLRVRQMNVFGEVAATGAKAVAWLTGARTGMDRLKLVVLARRYASEFSSLHGGPFSAYGGRNEWGLFTGAVWRPGRKTRFQATLDRHGRIAPEGRHTLPARGERFGLEMRRRLGGARMRLTLGTRRQTITTSGIKGMRHQKRARLRLTVPRSAARLNLWLEGAGARSPIRTSDGRAAGLDLRVQRGTGLRVDTWLALFDVTHFDSRIYTFEPDVWGGSRMHLLTGRGRTAGIRIICKGSRIRVSVRYAIKKTGDGTSSTWAAQIELGTRK